MQKNPEMDALIAQLSERDEIFKEFYETLKNADLARDNVDVSFPFHARALQQAASYALKSDVKGRKLTNYVVAAKMEPLLQSQLDELLQHENVATAKAELIHAQENRLQYPLVQQKWVDALREQGLNMDQIATLTDIALGKYGTDKASISLV